MKARTLITICTACISFLSFSAFAVEDVAVNYTMESGPSSDLSDMKISLRVAEFTDSRSIENPRLITNAKLLNTEGGFQAEQALAKIVQSAIKEGLAKANAKLVDVDGDMYLQGELLAIDAKIVDRAGVETLQLTLRTKVQLENESRTLWQSTLFARGRTPASEGMAAAVRATLDGLINELLRDDYFLEEIH